MVKVLRSLVVAAAVLLILPAVSAQSTPQDASARKTAFVTFYGHVFDTNRFTPMPMNTEFPAGENDFSAGYGGSCHDELGTTIPADPSAVTPWRGTCEEYAFNEVWFISSAGFVDISDDSEFQYDKLHNERGLTKPIIFDTANDVQAVFYMSADYQGWPSILCNPGDPDVDDVPWIPWCLNWDPGALPQWQVEATLYAAVLGEHGSGASEAADIDNAYRSGNLEILAQGVSAPVDVTSFEALGYPTVWEFAINMGPPKVKEVPREKSLVWRVQWHSLVNGQRTLEDNVLSWNVNSGEFYPPRITLPVKNAFDVELVLPQFVHGKLVLHGILNTPWGSYDADPESVRLRITTADGNREVETTRIDTFADYSVAHGGHYRPVNVTYVWDYRGDRVAPGDYKAIITAANHQNSATASCEATFRIGADGGGEVLEIGRCGTVSEGADEFARNQTGGGSGGGNLKLPHLSVLSGETNDVPAPLAPLALAALALAALRRRWLA